jgi:hypothetical protein
MHASQPIIWSTHSTDIQEFRSGLDHVSKGHVVSVMIMSCSDNGYNEASIKHILTACSVKVCGGIFPQVVNNGDIFTSGAIIVGFPFDVEICNYIDLSRDTQDLEEYIERHSGNIAQHKNFIMFADALCGANEDFIDYFYEYMGSGITVIGGGAGSLEFIPKPCIYTNTGLIHDAAQVVAIPGTLSRNIGHGWEVCDGPYLVTGAEGHRIDTLDYQPAFEVYQSCIEKLSGEKINQDNFFDIAKNFPLGIVNINGEILVRDPITTDLQFLECVGNVPINAAIHLLKGDQEQLLQSSKLVADTFVGFEGSNLLVLFDCISRILYLQDDFSLELESLQKTHAGLPMVGALSLGEITNSQYGSVDFLNKSTVIGML